jgi:hypothetical protein
LLPYYCPNDIQGCVMELKRKECLEKELERFTSVLRKEVEFVRKEKAQSLFLKCLGFHRVDDILSQLPIALDEKTNVDCSHLGSQGFYCDFSSPMNKTAYFPFLLDPQKESNKDVIQKLKKCLSGLYNVRNEHLEVVGEKAGYHLANCVIEGDIASAFDIATLILSIKDRRRKRALISQAINRIDLSHEKQHHLSLLFSLMPK